MMLGTRIPPGAQLGAHLTDLERLAADLGHTRVRDAARILVERHAELGWYVLLLGETSAGKSTWINSLLGAPVLPVAASPTTAVVVEVRFADAAAPAYAAWTQGTWTDVDVDRFSALAGGADTQVTRLRCTWPAAHTRARTEDVRGLVLLDTPGYDACVTHHADVLSNALPEADAVLSFTNHRTGFGPVDVAFLEQVRDAEVGAIIPVVNWVPETTSGKRLDAIQGGIARVMGRPVTVFPLQVVGRKGGPPPFRNAFPRSMPDAATLPVEVWSDAAWSALVAAGRNPAREAQARARIAGLAAELLAQLEADLRDRESVLGASEEHLAQVRTAIERLATARGASAAGVARAREEMTTTARKVTRDAGEAAWSTACAQIDDANRFLDASSCAAHITQHVVPQELRRAHTTLVAELSAQTQALGEELERLHADVDALHLPTVRVERPAAEAVRDAVAGRFARQYVEGAFLQAMRRYGGAAGPNAGFINFSKRALKNAGALVEKRFPKVVYDQMGPVFRKYGIRVGGASAAVATVAIEAGAYLYRVVRWKQKLRTLLERLLARTVTDEPLEDELVRAIPFFRRQSGTPLRELEDDAVKGIGEALDATLATVTDNLRHREEVLTAALDARARGPRAERDTLDALRRRADALRAALIPLPPNP